MASDEIARKNDRTTSDTPDHPFGWLVQLMGHEGLMMIAVALAVSVFVLIMFVLRSN